MIKGVICHACCSTRRRVISARKTLGGIRRRVECENGHRYTTIEVVMDDNTLVTIRKWGNQSLPAVAVEKMTPLTKRVKYTANKKSTEIESCRRWIRD